MAILHPKIQKKGKQAWKMQRFRNIAIVCYSTSIHLHGLYMLLRFRWSILLTRRFALRTFAYRLEPAGRKHQVELSIPLMDMKLAVLELGSVNALWSRGLKISKSSKAEQSTTAHSFARFSTQAQAKKNIFVTYIAT